MIRTPTSCGRARVSAEAPFLFLLFGNERALLLDTGAGGERPGERPLREVIDGLVDAWLAGHPREGYELVVAHTHGHNDHVAGCHIEMTGEPGRDYPLGCRYQPDEPPLQMTVAQLAAFRDAARSVAGRPGAHRFHNFLICNGPYRHYLVPLVLRSLWARITPSR